MEWPVHFFNFYVLYSVWAIAIIYLRQSEKIIFVQEKEKGNIDRNKINFQGYNIQTFSCCAKQTKQQRPKARGFTLAGVSSSLVGEGGGERGGYNLYCDRSLKGWAASTAVIGAAQLWVTVNQQGCLHIVCTQRTVITPSTLACRANSCRLSGRNCRETYCITRWFLLMN